MKWKKSPPELVALFEKAVAPFPKAERRRMFGYPVIFLNANMTAGLFQDRLMFRLSEKDREEFLSRAGARVFEPMPGRPMREYVEGPESVVKRPSELNAWLRRSVAYVDTLKPKAKGTPRRGKKKDA